MRELIFTTILLITFNLKSLGQNDMINNRGKLISEKYVGTIRSSEINNHYPESKKLQGNITHLPIYDIDIYRISYSSIFNGKEIELSGLIEIPKTNKKLDMMQYHHGTLYPYPASNGEGNTDAPSMYDGKIEKTNEEQKESRLFGNYLASYGYLVSMPDYVGYGISSKYEHPYSVNNALAEQSVDMILATKEFAKKKNINLSDKLFLSGWSEGGAVSMAVQKLIENDYKDTIAVTANAPLAGLYNTTFYSKHFLREITKVKEDIGNDLDVIIWALYAINNYTNNPIPNEKIFKYPVNKQLDVLKNRPTSIPAKLLHSLDKETQKKILAKVEENELAKSWSPIAPIYLHHGTDDDIVYYNYNVKVAQRNLQKKGGDVKVRTYKKHDHYTLAQLYLLSMIEDFNKYRCNR